MICEVGDLYIHEVLDTIYNSRLVEYNDAWQFYGCWVWEDESMSNLIGIGSRPCNEYKKEFGWAAKEEYKDSVYKFLCLNFWRMQ